MSRTVRPRSRSRDWRIGLADDLRDPAFAVAFLRASRPEDVRRDVAARLQGEAEAQRQARPTSDRASSDLRVFISNRESRCDDCGDELGRRATIVLGGNRGALCLSCADLDHLTFLPPGDAALTRRARKYSTLAAVVLKWSRARRRYERQGLLVEEQALQRAEVECLTDADARAKRRQREAERRAELDTEFVARFAARIRQLYPGCPLDRPEQVASHACQKNSGRIGRSAAARRLDDDAVHLAVVAHVRHDETHYDELLARGDERHEARDRVREDVDSVVSRWRKA